MKVNWKVRFRKKTFVVALAAFVGLIATNYFGVDAGEFDAIVNALLAVLVAGGIVVDPTTSGLNDSKQALEYVKPRKEDE